MTAAKRRGRRQRRNRILRRAARGHPVLPPVEWRRVDYWYARLWRVMHSLSLGTF